MKPRFLLCGLFLVTSLIAAGDVAYFQDQHQPYVINWESIACDSRDFLVMGNPFETYNDEVVRFLAKPRATNTSSDCTDR